MSKESCVVSEDIIHVLQQSSPVACLACWIAVAVNHGADILTESEWLHLELTYCSIRSVNHLFDYPNYPQRQNVTASMVGKNQSFTLKSQPKW